MTDFLSRTTHSYKFICKHLSAEVVTGKNIKFLCHVLSLIITKPRTKTQVSWCHWLHGRVDYLGTETYPAEISPWEQGSKLGHLFYIFLPLLSFVYVTKGYKEHLKQKNVKMPIIGVFS